MAFGPMVIVTIVGLLTFFIGLFVANKAVVEMSGRLDAKRGRHRRAWWKVIGHTAESVIRDYRSQSWQDAVPDKHLRRGYQIIAIGLGMALVGSVLGKYLRGSF